MAIDLSEVANDPDLGTCFQIVRTTGQFGLGGFQLTTPEKIQAFGIIEIADPEALRQVPEADRVTGALRLICAQPLNVTLEQTSGISDRIFWRGSYYRVQSVEPWKMNGFYSAILVRTKGD